MIGRALVRVLPLVPRPIVRRVASAYIAGESLDDALATIRQLNAQGKRATLDVLGEEVTSVSDSEESCAAT